VLVNAAPMLRRMPSFAIARDVHVNAPAATVHALIDDFRRWVQWSPWEGLDPALQRTYTGPDAGVGASYAWSGNRKAGAGSMHIRSSTPDLVEIDLQFLKPFKATNTISFSLLPSGSGTTVTWAMTGDRNLLMAMLGPLLFDRSIAKDFDRGLAELKSLAER
jgi:Polyketide cyclase / dehydrase and lipid transport